MSCIFLGLQNRYYKWNVQRDESRDVCDATEKTGHVGKDQKLITFIAIRELLQGLLNARLSF